MTAASLASIKKSDAPLRHVCPLIVGVGGTFRKQSTSDSALEVALTAAQATGTVRPRNDLRPEVLQGKMMQARRGRCW